MSSIKSLLCQILPTLPFCPEPPKSQADDSKIKATSTSIVLSSSTRAFGSTASVATVVSSSVNAASRSSSLSSVLSSTLLGSPSSSAITVSISTSSSPTSTLLTSVTTTSSSASSASSIVSPVATPASGNVNANILVIAKDTASAKSASSGFNGYGIPFTTLLVPQTGVALPALNTSGTGNFGGIVVVSEVSYDYGGTIGFQSALTTDQWNAIYAYQLAYGVRLVHIDVYPGPKFGATALGGCCNTGVEQLVSISDTSAFPQAGYNVGAGMSTQGLYHYPASISDTNSTKEFARFAANGNFGSVSTAAVISNFNGRQQMAFFIGWATDWSPTSNFLQHSYITWITRGLYAGYRRTNLNLQIDDMFLITDVYSPNGTQFRVRAADLTAHVSWITAINSKLNTGSTFFPEIGHNGNGNIEASQSIAENRNQNTCDPGSIQYDADPDTPLEFQKALGTGTDKWPDTPSTYAYTTQCENLDSLMVWFKTAANRDKFAHITHTFTHLELNNATYSDAYKEINWNVNWMQQAGIAGAKYFTGNGLIPPAITGLHNGDAIRAWADNGLTNCVGDNTRPVLRNQQNDMWPLITTVASNGYAGFQINPRWATRIYYNCDKPACTTLEWINTSAGKGTFDDLLSTEKADTTRHLMGMYHDPYMFHQANLRQTDVDQVTINGVTAKLSLFQTWTETIVQEFVRLVNWPVVSQKHADMSAAFAARMARDQCNYQISWNAVNGTIGSVTVSANGNTCASPIPITFPTGNAPVNKLGFPTEQLGNDPLTVWTTLSGSPITFQLAAPLKL